MGKDRWTVKTSAPIPTTKPTAIPLPAFVKLAVPAAVTSGKTGVKTLETRYDDDLGGGLREGTLVSITGWVRFIKLSSADCDYHIQITPIWTRRTVW